MNNIRIHLLAIGLVTLGLATETLAQEPAPVPEEPQPSARTERGEVVRFGSDFTLNIGETAEEMAVLFGDARIAGYVDGDVAVAFGELSLAESAVIDGDVAVIGGATTVQSGARVEGDLAVIGGSLDAPPGFSPRGEQFVMLAEVVQGRFAPMLRWVTEGLLWGRLIVPSIPWVWLPVVVVALFFLAINFVFERPVRACAQVLSKRPITTCLVGVLVALLAGPLSVVLLISIIGLPVVPLLWFALFLASVFGRVGVTRWIGGKILAEDSSVDRLIAARSVGIGLGVLCIAYMVPVVGIASWMIVGVAGLGAAATTFFDSLRREHSDRPAPEPATVAVPPPGSSREASDVVDDPDLHPDQPVNTAVDGREDLPIAGFASRLGAVAIDAILLAIISSFLDLDWRATFALVLAYHVVLWAWKSTTVGGIVCRVRLVRADRKQPAFTDGLVRGLAAILSVATAGLGWLWMLWDSKGQSWHDRIAGTYVVRIPQDAPLP